MSGNRNSLKRSDIPALILAGGMGTRISEETHNKPKPLVEIGGLPLILHISSISAVEQERWRIRIVDTGLNSMTGARVARALDSISVTDKFEHFVLTFGDGLTDANLDDELKFHTTHYTRQDRHCSGGKKSGQVRRARYFRPVQGERFFGEARGATGFH